jgi:thioredoxin 1
METTSSIVHATDSTFEQEVLRAETPVMVDFWAPWCGPCKTMSEALDQVAPRVDGRVKIVKINVDENPRISSQFGIRSIPSLVFFREGKPVGMIPGVLPGKVLEEVLDRHAEGTLQRPVPPGDASPSYPLGTGGIARVPIRPDVNSSQKILVPFD